MVIGLLIQVRFEKVHQEYIQSIWATTRANLKIRYQMSFISIFQIACMYYLKYFLNVYLLNRMPAKNSNKINKNARKIHNSSGTNKYSVKPQKGSYNDSKPK